MEAETEISDKMIIWGAEAIAAVIGRTPRQVFHALEKGELPGALKICGRWAFRPDVFLASFAPTINPGPLGRADRGC